MIARSASRDTPDAFEGTLTDDGGRLADALAGGDGRLGAAVVLDLRLGIVSEMELLLQRFASLPM